MKNLFRVCNYLLTLVATVFVVGCAVNSQTLINSNGQTVRCATSGAGIVGAITMSMHFDKCVEDYQNMGYEKIESAGVTGISRIVLEDKVLKITTVADNSPASKAGIVAGDILVSVDGQPRSNATDAVRALYGKAGSEVFVIVRKGKDEKKIALLRATYASVYGKGQAAAPASQ